MISFKWTQANAQIHSWTKIGNNSLNQASGCGAFFSIWIRTFAKIKMDSGHHIDQLIAQANDDMGASLALASAEFYGHTLFWAHLALEKYCKALWVFKSGNTKYPYIHNLLRLLKEAGQELSEEQITFYSAMNQFQAQGRYVDTLQKMEATITKEICFRFIEESKRQIEWMQQWMQKK